MENKNLFEIIDFENSYLPEISNNYPKNHPGIISVDDVVFANEIRNECGTFEGLDRIVSQD